jgi:hypothetical protein
MSSLEIRRFGSRTHRKFVHICFAEENSFFGAKFFNNMRIINRHNVSQHFGRTGRQKTFSADIIFDRAGDAGQRSDFFTGGDHGVNLGRLCQSIFFIQRHIGFDLILDSVDALIQSFSQFHGADFFINEFIMQFMSSALVKIHSSSSLSYSITRGTLKPPLWTAGAFFSASS